MSVSEPMNVSGRGDALLSKEIPPQNKPLHLGAIDIGTNSTHLLIVLIEPALKTFSIQLAEKATTRLGEGDFESENLTDLAMQRVIQVLSRFKDLANSYEVDELVVAATSAVREAPNGKYFLAKIKEEVGLDVDLVTGAEEARLIYLGVLSGMSFGDRSHLLVDIGGGSTELILADGQDAKALTSTKVGAVRLYRDLVKEDPIPPKRRAFLMSFIQGSLEPAVDKILSRINEDENPVLVATSGTAMALGALIAAEESPTVSRLHGYGFTKKQLDHLVEDLAVLTPQQRRKLGSINERRSDIIVPGALILQVVMKMLKTENLVLSERALREGLVVDWMLRHGLLEDRLVVQGSIRRRTVLHQVRRFSVDFSRAERVAKYALQFFDSTYGVLHFQNDLGRELLWAAAMLHACGIHINISSYHKHSWYLIRHGDLLGYSQSEHLIVAAIARYHRKSLPKKRHESWQLLTNDSQREIVLEMALLLRLAVALNLRPKNAIASIDVRTDDSEIICELIPESLNKDVSLELWNLKKINPIVKQLKGIELVFKSRN